MTWLKSDDGEGMAPWVFKVGNEAYGVYQRLGSYCAEHLTDGIVPAAMANMIAADVDPETGASRNLATLEFTSRITRDEMGTVTLPFFLDSNPTRAQVEADRETRKAKAKKAADARWKGGR